MIYEFEINSWNGTEKEDYMRNYNAYSSCYFTFFVLESFKINSKKKKTKLLLYICATCKKSKSKIFWDLLFKKIKFEIIIIIIIAIVI